MLSHIFDLGFIQERKRVNNVIRRNLGKINFYNENDRTPADKSIKEMIFEKKGWGECYTLAFFYCLFDESYKVAQGVTTIEIEGKSEKIPHCWCENDEFVFDPTWENHLYRRSDFYRAFGIVDKVYLYSLDEAIENASRTGRLDFWSNFTTHNNRNSDIGKCFRIIKDNLNKLKYFQWWIPDDGTGDGFTLQIYGQKEIVF